MTLWCQQSMLWLQCLQESNSLVCLQMPVNKNIVSIAVGLIGHIRCRWIGLIKRGMFTSAIVSQAGTFTCAHFISRDSHTPTRINDDPPSWTMSRCFLTPVLLFCPLCVWPDIPLSVCLSVWLSASLSVEKGERDKREEVWSGTEKMVIQQRPLAV